MLYEAASGTGVIGAAAGVGPLGAACRPAGVDSLDAEPSTADMSGDDLTSDRRLESDAPVDRRLVKLDPLTGAQSPPIVEAPEPVMKSAALDSSPPASPPTESADTAAPSSDDLPEPVTEPAPTRSVAAPAPLRSGFTVQVAALGERDAAQEMADGLSAKGFPAFVVDPAPDAPVALFRVLVGRYPDRRDAERMLHRLEREERFSPWITS